MTDLFIKSVKINWEKIDNDADAFSVLVKSLGIKRNPLKALITYRADAYMSRELAAMVNCKTVHSIESLSLQINTRALRYVIKEYELSEAEHVHYALENKETVFLYAIDESRWVRNPKKND